MGEKVTGLPLLEEIPVNWRVVEFGEVLDGGTRNGIYKPKAFHGRGTKIVNMGELFAFPRLRAVDMRRVELNEAELSRSDIRPGDLLFARRSLVAEGAGKCSIVLETDEPTTFESSIIRVRPDTAQADSLFLYYLFGSPFGTYSLGSILRHVAVAGITGSDLVRLPIPLPPLTEQRTIAHILGTLDDKIELNRRMNETLEEMARAIFKSWFVDFDPVRAKAEGRDPGLPKHIADLFPDRFEDSELGEIPAGWGIAVLGDHFDAVKGVSYKGSGLADIGMPLHNLNSVYEGGGYKYQGIKYYNGEYAERHIVEPGDVIVANTEQGHNRLLIGYAAIVPRFFGERGIISHHIYRLRPMRDSVLTAMFLCYVLNSPKMHGIVSGYANGTTVNMLPVDGVQKPQIIVPPSSLVTAFDRLATQLEGRREETIVESRTLAAVRDSLLPRLISGELRVGEAEEIVEETA